MSNKSLNFVVSPKKKIIFILLVFFIWIPTQWYNTEKTAQKTTLYTDPHASTEFVDFRNDSVS